MSANIIQQTSVDGQVMRSRVHRLQLLIGISVLTGLMVFFVSEKSAYASEVTDASQNTIERDVKQESADVILSQAQHPSHGQMSVDENTQLQSQISAVMSEDSMTFADSIQLGQTYGVEDTQLRSQAPSGTSEDSSELEQESAEEDDQPDAAAMFGDKGTNRWYVQTGAAFDIESENNGGFGLVGAGLTHFFLNGHSVNLELNGLGFLQDNDDAVGVNLALIMRWHVLRKQNWSLYVDGGAGLIGTTNSVPSRGSQFNFTPQVGAGTTIRVADQKHLMLGLRWHHISNADLYERNPGFDALMGYVGLNFPF